MASVIGQDPGGVSGLGPIASFGVLGDSKSGAGVIGNSDGGNGVFAISRRGQALIANSGGSNGVLGMGPAIGVLGSSDQGVGVWGETDGYNFGVVGKASNAGVVAFNSKNDHAAYLASACCAAWFTGTVHVNGPLVKAGGGFQIDHPLDPRGKFLAHSFVESPEMKNLYDGVVRADAKGRAVVQLPAWFETLNRDFRYQLTPLGGAAPDLHVAAEIRRGRFTIAGARPRMNVSWQVTGVRQDAWARANPLPVEERKSARERGYFIHPELYGASQAKALGRLRHPERTRPKRPRKPKLR